MQLPISHSNYGRISYRFRDIGRVSGNSFILRLLVAVAL